MTNLDEVLHERAMWAALDKLHTDAVKHGRMMFALGFVAGLVMGLAFWSML